MLDSSAAEINIEDDSTEEDFSNAFGNEEDNISSALSVTKKEELNTHNKVRTDLCGEILKLEAGYSKTILKTTKDMVCDEFGLIHSGFVSAAADYAAVVSINEQNVVIIGSRSSFLAPAKLNDLIEFEAKARFEDSRKREIKVTGYINQIKIFEGLFQAIVLEKHIFQTKIKNAGRRY